MRTAQAVPAAGIYISLCCGRTVQVLRLDTLPACSTCGHPASYLKLRSLTARAA